MNWIRPVYLYLFSLLGLVLITIGSVQLVGLALRTYVLTDADAEVRIRYGPEPPAAVARERIEGLEGDTTLAPATREALNRWAREYERAREARESLDPVRSRRQREAAGAIALLVVGLPLYIYHWRTIRRERTPVA
ncbi:MAG: hypothetical protein ACOCVZ_05975 [Gemmatimonadota bacterium]